MDHSDEMWDETVRRIVAAERENGGKLYATAQDLEVSPARAKVDILPVTQPLTRKEQFDMILRRLTSDGLLRQPV